MNRQLFLRSFVSAGIGTMLAKKGFARNNEKAVDSFAAAVVPPYLKAGDTVAITCPAGAVDLARVQSCCNVLEKWGLRVKFGNTVGKRWQRFSGTDDERLADLQELIDDRNVKAIIFGKGGYGTMRIIDKLQWENFKENPKWLVGYSDLTVVHLHVHRNLNVCTIHGDMSNGFSDDPNDTSVLSLYDALFGTDSSFKIAAHEMNRTGTAAAKLVGGNLTLLHACAGSKSDISTNGKILFLEDVSEYKYNIDRMMMSLKRSGKLDKLAGLVVGEFSATRNDEENAFDMKLEDIIMEKVKEYDYPVCFHFPAGHIADNRALKMGVRYEFTVCRDCVTLAETASVSRGMENNIFLK